MLDSMPRPRTVQGKLYLARIILSRLRFDATVYGSNTEANYRYIEVLEQKIEHLLKHPDCGEWRLSTSTRDRLFSWMSRNMKNMPHRIRNEQHRHRPRDERGRFVAR